MPLFRGPPVRLQPYLGYRSAKRLIIEARALRSAVPRFEASGRLRAIRMMIGQFASREAAGVRVVLETGSPRGEVGQHEAVTDAEGYVRFDVALDPSCPLPRHPVWDIVTLRWTNREGAQSVEGHVLTPGTESLLAVISDIDDTIIETGITGGPRAILRQWRRLIAEFPEERIVAPGAGAFYHSLGGGEVQSSAAAIAGQAIPATHRPFFYVSSSPWNLFSYLLAFKRAKGLPIGPLLLRDWGLNRQTFGSASHGAHKRDSIRKIINLYPNLRFALIGDDTQGDLPAYAEALAEHPERVAAVFIRTSSGVPLSAAEQDARAAIEAAGVPLWLGDSWDTGFDFLEAGGFTRGGETEQIVRAVEKMPTAGDG